MRLASFVSLVAAFLGCERAAPKPAPHDAAIAPMAVAPETRAERVERLVDDLAKLAVADALVPSVRRERVARLLGDPASAEQLIDELLADRRFAGDVAVGLLMREHFAANNLPISMVLASKPLDQLAGHQGGPAPEPVYFLRAPCAASDVERVEPWWAPGTRVLVCAEAHRPNVTGDGKYRCGSRMLAPSQSSVCGCGRNLVQCARDPEHLRSVRTSVRREVADTIAYTVEHDEPIARVFLRDDSVRDATTELLDRRYRIMNGEDVALDALRASTTPTPRSEAFVGHHAGILTTPHLLYKVDAPRAMVRIFYELMWCQEAASANVATDAILALDALDLRQGEGWKKLAAMPVCTSCHARLDYGVQFFSGFPSPIHGVDFIPARHHAGEGPLYAADISDPIGVAPLTPRGFAERATAQPAFGACMVKRVSEHVFGADASAADQAALREAFAAKSTLRALMREALVRLARARLSPPGPSVALPASLDAALADHCNDCHDDGPVKLTAPSRELALSMLAQVAFRGMPRDGALPEPTRAAMVQSLVTTLFPDEAARAEALRFYLGGMRAHRVHRPGAALQAAQTSVGDKQELPLAAIEQTLSPAQNQLTPGYATTVGLTALAICKGSKKSPEELARCVDALSAPARVIVE